MSAENDVDGTDTLTADWLNMNGSLIWERNDYGAVWQTFVWFASLDWYSLERVPKCFLTILIKNWHEDVLKMLSIGGLCNWMVIMDFKSILE